MPYLGQAPTKGDENNFKILDNISSYTLTFDGSDATVVSAANDTITSLTHRFVQGQRVTYHNGGGSNIAGLTSGTAYYIIKHDHHNIKLATSASNAANGTAVNITNVGGGTSHTINVAFDGINTKFKATHTNGQKARITRSAQLVISINGVIQQPHDTATPSTGFGFDLDGTIVLSQAPVAGDVYWAHVLTNNNVTFDISDNDVDNFTGNASTVSFNLSKTPPDNRNVLVTIDGVVQYPNDPDGTVRAYNVVENVLTFTTAPVAGAEIQVRHIGFAGSSSGSGGGGVTNFYGRTGSVVLKNTDNIVANNAEFAGNLTVQGTMTTLDTKLTEVDQLEVAANNTTVGVAITQSGSGDILNLYDGSTEVFSVADGGNVTSTGDLTISSILPRITLNDTNQESDYEIKNENGSFRIRDIDNPTDRYRINSSGGTIHQFLGTADFNSHLTVNGTLNILDNIVHIGDPNTKFGFPAGDTITFETAGNERLRIKSTGQILYSSSSGDNQITSKRTNAANGNGNYFFHLLATNNSDTAIGSFGFHRDTAVDDSRFVLFTRNTGGSNTERLRITSGGYVGINTNDPLYPLHVKGDTTNTAPNATGILMGLQHEYAAIHLNAADTKGSLIDFSVPGQDRKGGIQYLHSNNPTTANRDAMLFYTNGTNERLRIASDGKITSSYQIVNATAPDFPFVISQVDPSNTVNQLGGSGVGLIFSPATNSVAEVGAGIAAVKPGDSDGDSTSDLAFYVSQNDETLDEAVRITSTGQVSISGAGTTFGVAKLNIAPANRTSAFSASDGDTWHDVVIKQSASATTNSVGIAFEISPSAYHKNAGTGIVAIKDGNNFDYGTHLAFITRPHTAVAEERLRIVSTGQVQLNGATGKSTSGTSATDLLMANGAAIRFRRANDSNWVNTIGLDNSDNLKLGWGGSVDEIHFGIAGIGQQMTLDSSGNLLIGRTAWVDNHFDNGIYLAGSTQAGMKFMRTASGSAGTYDIGIDTDRAFKFVYAGDSGGTGTEKFRIGSSGNFTFFTNAAAWNTLQRATATHYIGLRIQETDGTQRMQFGVAGATNNIANGSAQHDVVLKSYANLLLATNQTERFRINSDGQLLHTANKSSAYTARFVQAHSSNPAWIEIDSPSDNNLRPAYIQLQNAGTNKWGIGQVYQSTSSGAFHISAGAHSEANSKFVVTTAGKIGIGTDNPTYKLHVDSGDAAIGLWKSRRSSGSYIDYSLGANGAALGFIGAGGQIISSAGANAGDFAIRSQGDLLFSSGGSVERLRLASTGHTRIENELNALTDLSTASNYHLHLSNPANDAGEAVGMCFGLSTGRDIGAAIYHSRTGSTSYGDLMFATKPNGGSVTERMRIDSSGRVVVGGSSLYIGGAALAVLGTGTTPNTYGSFAIGKIGANPTAGTTLANIRLNGGSVGTRRGAEINAKAANNWTDGSSHPTTLSFAVAKEGSASVTDRVIINHYGHFQVTNENALPSGSTVGGTNGFKGLSQHGYQHWGQRQYYSGQRNLTQNQYFDLFQNNINHDDIIFWLNIKGYHSNRTFATAHGTIGGYGLSVSYQSASGVYGSFSGVDVAGYGGARRILRWTSTSPNSANWWIWGWFSGTAYTSTLTGWAAGQLH